MILPAKKLTIMFFVLFLFPQLLGYSVRVLLDEREQGDSVALRVSSSYGISLVDLQVGQKSKKSYKKIYVTFQDHALVVNGRRCPCSSFCCEPVHGSLTFDGNHYSGTICFQLYKGKILVINVVDLEDYIFSVLRTESWPGWPLEINKVLAIVCRSYAISKILETRLTKKPYHMKNTNTHQTYQGIHKSVHLRQAVDETRHMFIAYNKKPIVAMYDSCCGGVVPGLMKGFNFDQAPYLARMYPCLYCASYKIFNWHAHYSARELAQVVKELGKTVPEITDVLITARDDAGVVQKMTLKTEAKAVALSGSQVYSLLKKIKSRFFSIIREPKGFTFEGRGYGHHVGLCQWGARELVRRGWSMRQIIEFYYPKTQLMKLKDQDLHALEHSTAEDSNAEL